MYSLTATGFNCVCKTDHKKLISIYTGPSLFERRLLQILLVFTSMKWSGKPTVDGRGFSIF